MQGAGVRGRGSGKVGGFAAVGLMLLAALVVAQPPVKVTTRVEPETVSIGTPFRYYVRVESTGDAEVVMPLLVERIGDFMIRDFGSTEPAADAAGSVTVTERWYELIGYTPGVQSVDGGSISYRVAGGELEQLEVPDAVVTIASLLDGLDETAAATADIRDIHGPVRVPEPARPWWLLAVGAALAALVTWAIWRWSSRRRAVAAVFARPAHEIALEALAALHAARLLSDGRHAEFYVRLSGIVRAYVEGRFRMRAPEMTTEEFLQAAQSNRELPAADRSRLNEFLREADLVKFARHVPTVEQGERAFEAARDFVARTAPQPEEAHAAA